ncbi:MAG: inositol monophosphatase [Bacillota bacterium]
MGLGREEVDRLCAAAVSAAATGRDVALAWLGRHRVWPKGSLDIVTDADLASREAVRAFLARNCPDEAVFDEEGGIMPGPQGRFWVVDPLDGTVNASAGFPLWSVSVALLEHGRELAGAVCAPGEGAYSAAAGRGARCGGRPLAPSRTRALRDAVVSVTVAPGYSPQEMALALACFGKLARRVRGVRVFCSGALELCWVASGKLDACVCPAQAFFSAAAGVLIAREAGCSVLDLEGRSYRAGESSGLVAACTPELASEVLATLPV